MENTQVQNQPKLLITDGYNIMYKAFFAMPMLTANGKNTGALHGFLTMVLTQIQNEGAGYLAVAFDEKTPTFRHVQYKEYKAGRPPMPPELSEQVEEIRVLLNKMHIACVSAPGWEADDVMGTLAAKAVENGVVPIIYSGDRDILQLVSDKVTQLFPKNGSEPAVHFTPEKVKEVYGITPSQVVDWKALSGDKSDNLPGIEGVGDKTAVKYLTQYGDFENVIAHGAEIGGKRGERVIRDADKGRMTRELAKIRCDAPVEFNLNTFALHDMADAVPELEKLQLKNVIRLIKKGSTPTEEPREETRLVFGNKKKVTTGEEIYSAISSWLNNGSEVAVCATSFQFSAAELRNGSPAGYIFADFESTASQLSFFADAPTPLTLQAALLALSKAAAGKKIITHEGKALLHQMADAGVEALPDVFLWDTCLGAYLLDPEKGEYHLSDLTGVSSSITDFPEMRDDSGKKLPKPKVIQLLKDKMQNAELICQLYIAQSKQIEKLGMMPLMKDIELPLINVLFAMETAGIRVDREFISSLGEKYDNELKQLQQEIYAQCGCTFNIDSPQQLGDVLFERLKLPHGKKTTKGYSTSAEVLQDLCDIAPEIAKPILRYRQLSKLNGTYVKGMLPLLDGENRIHSTFNQTETATGRISSSEPNLQNIPVRTEEGKQLRKAFLPRPGWVLLDSDYSQIELRIMAHLSGDPAMVAAFTKNQDIHTITASEIFDVPVSEVTPQLRSRAKAVNFGLIYGISAFGLAKDTGVTQMEAADFMDKYYEKYPGVKRFMDECVENAATTGYAQTITNRRRNIPQLTSSNGNVRNFGKRAAMNTPIQGTAADIIKMAMVKVYTALAENHMESRLILQVHDELILECPPDEVDKAKALLQSSMESVISLKVPLKADVHQGCNWDEAK